MLSTEQPESTPHHCNSSTVIPSAANGNANTYSQCMSSLEKPAVLHFSVRGCGIQEVNSGQGIDPHNHIPNLTPATGDEGDCIRTRSPKENL